MYIFNEHLCVSVKFYLQTRYIDIELLLQNSFAFIFVLIENNQKIIYPKFVWRHIWDSIFSLSSERADFTLSRIDVLLRKCRMLNSLSQKQ